MGGSPEDGEDATDPTQERHDSLRAFLHYEDDLRELHGEGALYVRPKFYENPDEDTAITPRSPYFVVSDLDAALAMVVHRGGEVICGPMYGRPGAWALVNAAHGERLAILQR